MRNYSDTVPATTLVGSGAGVANGLTNSGTAMELSAPISGSIVPPFVLRLEPGTVNEELVLCTAGAGTSGSPYTITRAYGTTTAKAHATGCSVAHGIYSGDIGDPNGVHGLPNGLRVVGASISPTTTSTIANSTTETVIATYSIVPGDFIQGSSYTLRTAGSFGNVAAATPTFTLRARVGGVAGTLLSASHVYTTNAAVQSGQFWDAEVRLNIYGTPGAACAVRGIFRSAASLGNTTNTPLTSAANSIGSTLDLSTTQALVVTCQWSVANAANTLSAFHGQVEKLY